MNQFIACLCRNDLKTLCVEGIPDAEDLFIAWHQLFFEYCELSGAAETKYRVLLRTEIALLEKQNMIVQGWLDYLSVGYDPQVVEAIQYLDYPFEFNPEDEELYLHELKTFQQHLIMERLQIKIKKQELKAIEEAQSGTVEMDEKYFKTIFFRINNYAKREAVNGLTTVEDYCIALKEFTGAHSKIYN